jgi:hypothetical protein
MSNRNIPQDCIRQGDLLFVPVTHDRWTWYKDNKRKDGIIREGEATGHHHRLADPLSAEVFRPQWGQPMVVVGGQGATVVHEEHGPVNLLPNTTYEVNVAREWDIMEGERAVMD